MTPNNRHQIRHIAENHGVILLYHSVMPHAPKVPVRTVHNVTVQQLRQHLLDLSDFFEFVSLDEFSKARSKAGLACVTFDDGYSNVFENAMPVMQSMNCPFTVFLNPVTFGRRWNWRDKIRHLIHHQLVDEFLEYYPMAFTDGRFYRYSKHPANNSADLDRALDLFLSGSRIDLYGDYPYVSHDALVQNPLVSYGNHSLNHYVLSSLDEQQQYQEISIAHKLLSKISGLKISGCFSAPFGGSGDINSVTLDIIESAGYHSILMSRQCLQPEQSETFKVQVLERFMPRSDHLLIELASTCANM